MLAEINLCRNGSLLFFYLSICLGLKRFWGVTSLHCLNFWIEILKNSNLLDSISLKFQKNNPASHCDPCIPNSKHIMPAISFQYWGILTQPATFICGDILICSVWVRTILTIYIVSHSMAVLNYTLEHRWFEIVLVFQMNKINYCSLSSCTMKNYNERRNC